MVVQYPAVRWTIPALLTITLLLTAVFPAGALDIWTGDDGDNPVTFHPTLKAGGLLSRYPDDPQLFPETCSGLALYRFRFDLNVYRGESMNAACAYEHSGRWGSHDDPDTAGSGILPAAGEAPWRFTRLYEEWLTEDRLIATHEIDRALIALHPDWGDVIIGRQAIGLGRGRLFNAVDLFAPFSPLEIDREWRRGVDALRIEYRLSATSAVEIIGVFGRQWDESAALVRWRGYFGHTDAELLAGRRAEDEFLGLVLSSALLEAEWHAEAAVFRTPQPHPDGEPFGCDRIVPKLVLGLSYTFNIGNGLTVLGEYHYSGFGVKDTQDISRQLSMPEYQNRYLRGDMQILGRHAMGFQTSYPINESLQAGTNLFISPTDRSGILSPSLRWDFSRTGSFTLAGYLAWGDTPRDGEMQSEYGASPMSLFMQLSFYL